MHLWKIDFFYVCIRLLNNKFHGLSPSGGHHSLMFDQGFQKIAGRDWLERHLTVLCINEIVPSHVVIRLNHALLEFLDFSFHPACLFCPVFLPILPKNCSAWLCLGKSWNSNEYCLTLTQNSQFSHFDRKTRQETNNAWNRIQNMSIYFLTYWFQQI